MKRIKDKTSEVLFYSITEVKALETHFAKMAAKGWLIEKINRKYEFIYQKT